MQYRVRHVPRSDQHVFIVFWIESNDNNVQYIIGWSVVWCGVALLSLRIHTIDDAQNSSVHVRASVALSLSPSICARCKPLSPADLLLIHHLVVVVIIVPM
jgi:hypothetical protein